MKAGAVSMLPRIARGEEASPKLPGVRALLRRAQPEVYEGPELRFIGMPVGGLFAGTVYLGGDGQLWNWDIFNQVRLGCVERAPTTFMGDTLNAMGGANYVDPVRQQSPFTQRHRLFIEEGDFRPVRFGQIQFRGEYPVGKVSYSGADADVEMSLEALSPFCPQDVDSSSFPATTLTFRLRNTGQTSHRFRIQYESENPVLVNSRKTRGDALQTTSATPSGGVRFGAQAKPKPASLRKEVRYEDWSSGSYGKWVATGTAFGTGPQKVTNLPGYMGSVRAGTDYVVNSHQTRNGEDVVKGDAHVGTLRSPDFTVERNYINLRVGGGAHKGQTCINLIVGEQVVRTVTGRDSNVMNWESFAVEEFVGKTAHLEVVDQATGGWGQISLGEVIFADEPAELEDLAKLPDFGTFCVDVVEGANHRVLSPERAEVGRTVSLKPGESTTVTLVIAWHFPNCGSNLPGKRNWYAKCWKDAEAISRELISRWPSLQATTRKWNETWYDSTLPHWFLDRTFLNTSILATKTCHRLDEGRFYFMEGVGCCDGTCTHVWGYAQAIGRVFPEVERYLRKEIDFGLAYRPESGAIDYRAEYHRVVATDGQASCILRAYREHQMSADTGFLKSIWPQVKGATNYLIQQDLNRDGVLDGAQYNTLDTAWYGEIAWISSLYVAALRASEAMATAVGDADFARQCGEIAARGSRKLTADLFDGEYFINRVDASHPEANNTNRGCHIDQVYGQSWAHQVGLPRVLPLPQTKSALKSLYKYNFYEDVWEYRRSHRQIPGGRWYAAPQEAGLIMCSFPKGGAAESVGKGGDAWAVGYFNECMSGFEYQVANHMIAEGMLEEGLKVVYAIHQRYHPSKRNPYNEVECSDHYGRAMASYGSFVSITGFVNDGPNHRMSFSPKLKGRFRCAFINERGWGTYERSESGAESTTYHYEIPIKSA
jgi:non-lysosomal glucosylceramidase